MLAKLLIGALILLVPTAAAAVTVESIVVPPRTAAAHPFDVNVTLANDGAARSVFLFGALYDAGSGCGPAAGPGFRTFTHMVQEQVDLAANSVTPYPTVGDRWLHRYDSNDADAEPTTLELCVFVANASSGPVIDYESFATTPLSVRPTNAVPEVSFTWTPESPSVGETVTFAATGSDADGDPLAFAWDFGHFVASGRAVAEGARVTLAFHSAGEYAITLAASDGLDVTHATRVVDVGVPGEEPERSIPAPALALLTLALAGASRLRRRAG